MARIGAYHRVIGRRLPIGDLWRQPTAVLNFSGWADRRSNLAWHLDQYWRCFIHHSPVNLADGSRGLSDYRIISR